MSTSIEKTAFLKRLSENIFSYDIPDSEKKIAEEASLRFEYSIKALNSATKHLDTIYRPFEMHDSVSVKSVVEGRGILNRFRQASKDKFEKFKARVVLAIQKLHYFSNGDTEIQELISSFEQGAEGVTKKVEEFYEIMEDLENPEFKNSIMSAIDTIKVEVDELNEITKDRIIKHIDEHLIGKTWMTETKDKLNVDFENSVPLITQLFDERKEMQEGSSFPSLGKDNQALNVSDAQKASYPDRIRTMNIDDFGV